MTVFLHPRIAAGNPHKNGTSPPLLPRSSFTLKGFSNGPARDFRRVAASACVPPHGCALSLLSSDSAHCRKEGGGGGEGAEGGGGEGAEGGGEAGGGVDKRSSGRGGGSGSSGGGGRAGLHIHKSKRKKNWVSPKYVTFFIKKKLY